MAMQELHNRPNRRRAPRYEHDVVYTVRLWRASTQMLYVRDVWARSARGAKQRARDLVPGNPTDYATLACIRSESRYE